MMMMLLLAALFWEGGVWVDRAHPVAMLTLGSSLIGLRAAATAGCRSCGCCCLECLLLEVPEGMG